MPHNSTVKKPKVCVLRPNIVNVRLADRTKVKALPTRTNY